MASRPDRYIVHDGRAPSADELPVSAHQLVAALNTTYARVAAYYNGSHHRTHRSVYIGDEGIALAELYLASSALPTAQLPIPAENLRISALVRLSTSRDLLSAPRDAAHSSFLKTSVGTATLVLCATLMSSECAEGLGERVGAAMGVLRAAVELVKVDMQGRPGDGCEVLYGRAGLVYALLTLRQTRSRACENASGVLISEVEALTSDEALRGLVGDIVERGEAGARAYATRRSGAEGESMPGYMWEWHGKLYLGGAHGVAGILQMLLACPDEVLAPCLPRIVQTVAWLLSLQDADGNFPHKASTSVWSVGEDLVQWCHGAPAVLILLSTLLRRADASEIVGAAVSADLRVALREGLERGAELVHTRGLLRKGVGLCHGVGGSVFALLAAADALDEAGGRRWLCAATHLALLATEWRQLTEAGEMNVPDHRWSLYEGATGMCCAWAAVLVRVFGGEPQGMVGYDDLGYKTAL